MLASCLDFSVTIVQGSASKICMFCRRTEQHNLVHLIVSLCLHFLSLPKCLPYVVIFLKAAFFCYTKFLLFHLYPYFLHRLSDHQRNNAHQKWKKSYRLWFGMRRSEIPFPALSQASCGTFCKLLYLTLNLFTLRQWVTALCNEYSLLTKIVM